MTKQEAVRNIKELNAVCWQKDFYNEKFAKSLALAIRSLEAWKSVIEEINEVDFYFLIAESGSCASEVLKTSLLNTIKKALKEVES